MTTDSDAHLHTRRRPTLGGLYRICRDEVPPILIGRRALASLDQIVATVPSHADTVGLELRLDGEDGRIDLGVGVSLKSGSDLFNMARVPDLSRAVHVDGRWRRIHDFGRRWTTESSWQLRAPFLFFEYDEDVPLEPIPVPSVFVGLDWPLVELGEEARRLGREDPALTPGLSSVKQMLGTLRPQPLSAAADSLFERCFALMPTGGLVLHLAVMLGRPGAAVRLSLSVPCNEAPAYLDALGWSQGRSALERALAFEADASGSILPQRIVQIDVDVGDALGSAVGLMLQPSPAGSWRRLLDALVAAGYCDAARRDALLAWPGTATAAGEGAPIERYLAHAKITCGKNVEPKAKAYIGVRPASP